MVGRVKERDVSTVLWANRLRDGVVQSDTSDKYALYRHSRKLDAVCKRSSGLSFNQLCDTTDLRFNIEALELPEGLASTDELMAREDAYFRLYEAQARNAAGEDDRASDEAEDAA